MLEAIHVTPEKHATPLPLEEATLTKGRAIPGDRREQKAHPSRPVTLIRAETLEDVGRELGVEVAPGSSRRNLTVRGLDLDAFQFGGAVLGIGKSVRLLVHGPCDPCARMEKALGKGAKNLMAGRGGLVASVLEGGTIRVGDAVRLVERHS